MPSLKLVTIVTFNKLEKETDGFCSGIEGHDPKEIG
jgi:hypothetical protein